MPARLAILSSIIGFGFLASAVFTFLHRAESSKAGPSLLQGLLDGFGVLWLQMAWFIAAFTLLHAIAGWLAGYLIHPVAQRVTGENPQARRLTLLLFLVAVLAITLESAARFHLSLAGTAMHDFAGSNPGFGVRIIAIFSLAMVACVGLGIRLWPLVRRAKSQPILSVAIFAIAALAIGGWKFMNQGDASRFPVDRSRPHVVIVGIDGWRPDTLKQFGASSTYMPFVEDFIAQSAYIEEALTPLARSFPAWWTILSGQYPITHGARFNLIGPERINSQADLAIQLGKRGYHRIFAIDERRFANIRAEHGFDQVAGPSVGAADFLIGGLNDTPLSNLIVNTWAGKFLFPFNHANRAADITYVPQTFDALLASAIKRAPRVPLFLAVHYELPHWPFTWANGPSGKHRPHRLGNDYADYLETLEVVDKQVERLYSTLQSLGVLDNAILVLLSDHGEAFSLEDVTWTNVHTNQGLPTPAGHATHAFGVTQNRIPLAFRRFGGSALTPGVRKGQASLADVYPTLSDWLNLTPGHELDGQSLLPFLYNQDVEIPAKAIPIETGFNTSSMFAGNLSRARLFHEGAAYYEITSQGLLRLRNAEIEHLMRQKQRAVVLGENIITTASKPFATATQAWRIGNTRRLTYQDISIDDLSGQPGQTMAQAFCKLYEPDASFLDPAYCGKVPVQ